jgi:putative flippase GtrA
MASALSRLTAGALRRLPGPVRRKLEGETGKRFVRFVLVAVAAVISSQVALVIFLDAAHRTAGISGGLAAMVGAAVSYVLSRWAWERKGRPHVLKETLPFWIVSVTAWIILGLATKLGVHLATGAGLDRGSLQWHVVVNGTYLAANVMTFLARFVIFHYVLFADRGSSAGGTPEVGAGTAAPASSGAAAGDETAEDASAAIGIPRSPTAG